MANETKLPAAKTRDAEKLRAELEHIARRWAVADRASNASERAAQEASKTAERLAAEARDLRAQLNETCMRYAALLAEL